VINTPRYITTGTMCYQDELCDTCAQIDYCNVFTDLLFNKTDSEYNETKIKECQSYTKMREKKDTNWGTETYVQAEEAQPKQEDLNDTREMSKAEYEKYLETNYGIDVSQLYRPTVPDEKDILN
jgi:hypothetical protein